MPDEDRFERFVVRNKDRPGEFEWRLDSIRFMREELGIGSQAELPDSLGAARREYSELKSRVEPPTDAQRKKVSFLLKTTGGEMTGKLHSARQADLLIRELEGVHFAQRAMGELPMHRRERERQQREAESTKTVGIAIGAGVGVALLLSALIWTETALVLFFLVLAALFVVFASLHVLGLWR